jgi:ATP-binding cassette, subfamily D (ALD), peroxisomal long-chain fatty acid import protein
MAVQSREDPVTILYNHYLRLFRTRLQRTSRTARLAATLALLLSITSGTYGGYRWWKVLSKEKAQGRTLLRKNSGLRGKDGSRIIYVPYRNSTTKVVIHPTKATTFDAHRRLFLHPPRAARLTSGASTPAFGPPPQTKAGLNLAFLHQFLSLLSIMIPRFRSKETGLLVSHGLFLILRTYLSLVVARLDGAIVRDLVAGQGKPFLLGIVRWLSVGTLASYTNSMIKFLQSKISIAFRTRLTRYIHDLYLNSNMNYYKLTNLDGSIGQSADQFITQDLTLFCTAAASLYSSLGKPLVDIFVFNYQLYKSLGPLALTGLLANYFATATALRRLSPPFGKLKAVEGKKEGDFRALHARLIANAEEVAFYGGADIEKVYLNKSFKELRSWMEGIYSLKVRYNMLEDFILKYSWSAFGYIITSLPVFLPAWGGLAGVLEESASPTQHRERGRMKEFITNKRLMLSLADAGGRMMYSIKDLSELAGYTSRVYTLISTLHRVHANAYLSSRRSPAGLELYSLADVQGTVQAGFDGVRLEDVPVVAPSLFPYGGDELIESLSFVVHSGEHLLISGSNGVGKSAVARIVAGLWPVYRGLVSKPRGTGIDGIMFLPQRPYLSVGTLRDQVIYPHTEMNMRESGRNDNQLQQVLDDAKLGYLTEREGGWDTRKEWKDVLSGGEKQRMAIARILYHEPRYAFVDEGTSAVSSDVEGLLYEICKERGVTLITISTRASLKKYHVWNLTLGLGAEGEEWEMKRIGTAEEKQEVEKELEGLKAELAKVEEWERRKAEIDSELARVWVKGSDSDANERQELHEPEYIGFGSDESSMKGSSNLDAEGTTASGPESSLEMVDSSRSAES